MKQRILALSRDRGSMQAIAPVIAVLQASGDLELSTYATRESWPVTIELGLHALRLDETAFAANPAACIRSLLDIHRPDLVLSGSSPARGTAPETPEQFAILEARRSGAPSLAVLDYWGMYAERFSRDGFTLAEDLLPDRLCVLDRRALSDLEVFGVPVSRMTITHNPWLDRLVGHASVAIPAQLAQTARGITVLLVSQPLAEMRHVRNWPYDQFTMFECLLAAMPSPTSVGHGGTIQILPHPSENVSRWEAVLAKRDRCDIEVELLQGRVPDLLHDADYLVTSHSTLAYEALYFGMPCISLRPAMESVMRLWIDDAGLSQVFQDADSLRQYLAASDPAAERQRVLRLKRELGAGGLFFSDGQATGRVVNEVAGLLGSVAKDSLQ